MSSPNYSYLSIVGPWPLKITTSDTINPGDMLFWDAATKTNRPLTDPTKGDLFSGVSLGEYPPSSNLGNGVLVPDPNVPATFGDEVHKFFATAGETLTMGDGVYVGADSQTVVKAAPGGTTVADIIGYFWPDSGDDQVVAATNKVQIRIRTNWPSPDLA